MTAQIGDRFKLNNDEFSIVAINSPLQFIPENYGITPAMRTTACWRGYWCVYNITDTGIYVEDLYINSKDEKYPEISGVLPVFDDKTSERFLYMGHHMYKGLNIKIPYTGKILVGSSFLREYYIHMGFQRPWAYKILKELIFDNGNLIEIIDHSDKAEEIRNKIKLDKTFDDKLKSDIPKFVEESFSLDFNTKAWWLE